MKKISILFLILLTLGCKDTTPPADVALTLAEGESSYFPAPKGDVAIHILEIQDGRCPSDAMCLWAGVASVKLRLKSGSALLETELFTPEYSDSPGKRTLEVGGQQIKLVLRDIVPLRCMSCKSEEPSRAIVVIEK